MFFAPVSIFRRDPLILPAFTAYLNPASDGAAIDDDGTVHDWKGSRTRFEWGGLLDASGELHLLVHLKLADGARASYRLSSGAWAKTASIVGGSTDSTLDFGTLNIAKPGWRTFYLQGIKTSGPDYGALQNLQLEGEAATGAKFNLKERRNAASVHLLFPTPKSDRIEWFYNEVTAKEDPVDTYYMATGFNRGYFGMQVNDAHERRIIFSVWDSGKEAVDRSKVSKEDQVQLISKGPGVVASGFGNEGTGGHSHLSYMWKTGVTQKFLLHARPDGEKTIYTGYFWMAEKGGWNEIASFSAPHDGTTLHGLYSFVEDFNGDNGNLKRKALYGPAWIKTSTGDWKPLTTAKFSHDGTGGKDRFDYDFGIVGNCFYLQNGGFQGRSPKYGTEAILKSAPTRKPNVDLTKFKSEG